jgi:hypothetical protein
VTTQSGLTLITQRFYPATRAKDSKASQLFAELFWRIPQQTNEFDLSLAA